MLASPLIAAPGDLDSSFGGTGKVFINFDGLGFYHVGGAQLDGFALQGDGKVLFTVILGARTSPDVGGIYPVLVRLNHDGSLDSTMNGTGMLLGVGGPLAVQPDGKILTSSGRLHPDGSLDTTFHAISVGRETVIQSDGRILTVGGDLRRYGQNGDLDTSFDGDGIVSIGDGKSLAVQADGKILVTRSGFSVSRYNANGSLDLSFNGSGTVSMNSTGAQAADVEVQADDKIVVAGDAPLLSESGRDFVLNRYLPDGSLDLTFNGNGIVLASFDRL